MLDEAVEMIRSLNGQFQKQKNFGYDEGVADFIDCSLTNECDDLLKHKGVSVGFITSNGVDTAAHYYNFETEQIEEL